MPLKLKIKGIRSEVPSVHPIEDKVKVFGVIKQKNTVANVPELIDLSLDSDEEDIDDNADVLSETEIDQLFKELVEKETDFNPYDLIMERKYNPPVRRIINQYERQIISVRNDLVVPRVRVDPMNVSRRLCVPNVPKDKPTASVSSNLLHPSPLDLAAAGPSTNNSINKTDVKYYQKLMEMFPDICPVFLKRISEPIVNEEIFDVTLSELLVGKCYFCTNI